MATTTYQSIGAATHLYESAGFTPMLTTREGNRHINWYGQAL
jgi:hypothetical protein